ncbi:MAG: hypothetical protein ACTILH_09745 [Corynebacterium casei]|uniref:hypothetical protein n=1 Tax=Corynebacterium casei TaxID=160386 RepID=UPI003F9BB101
MLRSNYLIHSGTNYPPIWVDASINFGSAVLGGIISGLIVAWAVKHATRRSKPLFEYFDTGISDGTAHLFYNGTKPIVIGGSYAHHHGPALFERSPRAAPHGIFLKGQSNQVFRTANGQGPGLSPGERIEIVYRSAPRKMKKNHEARYDAFSMECDPAEILSARSRIREAKEKGQNPTFRDVKLIRTWQLEVVYLLPSSTIISH